MRAVVHAKGKHHEQQGKEENLWMTHEKWQAECMVLTPKTPIAIHDGSEPGCYDEMPLGERPFTILCIKHCNRRGDHDPEV
jgi:hypothetical protein